jgi:pyruvate/2-oxoglutarate/acetoin dehydrogenase E1 component
VYILGEDILDPYGGAFKVTRGLSAAFPDRVVSTPISEAGIVGIATGMALRGLRPVVEIMFGDFITLAADQIINHASKFRWMYNDQVHVPLVIRTPMGGRRGYGPTHSQTLEKHFLGVPGLRVVAPTLFGDPADLLYRIILDNQEPLLFVENKLLYLTPIQPEGEQGELSIQSVATLEHSRPFEPEAPTSQPRPTIYRVRVRGAPQPTLTIAVYGYMAELARQAILRLAYDFEIFAELFVPTQLSPFKFAPLITAVRQTGKLLVIEEGTRTMGWGAEIISTLTESSAHLNWSVSRLAALDLPVPASAPVEAAILPGVEDIIEAARRLD